MTLYKVEKIFMTRWLNKRFAVSVWCCALLAFAQESSVITPVGVSQWVSIVSIPSVPNVPFSATTMMENTQTAADGSTVTSKVMTTIARDSVGRTHNENRYTLRDSDNGVGRIRDITIYDPVKRTRTTLLPASHQARVVSLPPRRTTPSAVPAAGVQQTANPPNVQREDLGMSSIDGMSVHGTRRTRTILEGQEGNDHAIAVTDEYWYSEDLHMNVTVKHTDPRHGTQIVTLTQVNRGEPDPAMFEIPSGYAVQSDADMESAVRIGPAVAAANLIQRIEPQYPALALGARVQGQVEFNAVIGEDGVVKSLNLVRGHPLLVNSAKEAVLQWRYRPTLLNGNPVVVTTSIVVNFTLPGQNQ